MRQKLRMPALGQTSDELTILKWWKEVGDSVEQGELLLEVETDKATLEVESALEGMVLELLFEEGDVVETGTPIAIIGDEADEDDSAEMPNAVQSTEEKRFVSSMPSPPQPPVPATPKQPLPPAPRRATKPAISTNAVKRVIARPTARYLARLHGVSLDQVRGTGRDGLIEKRDVQAYIDRQYQKIAKLAKLGGPVSPESKRDFAVPDYRQKIAQQVTQSAQTIPQIQLSVTVDMDGVLTFIDMQRQGGLNQLKVTHLILRAMSAALAQYPQVNTLWIDDGPLYRQLGATHVGLAVAKDDQLLVASINEPGSTPLETLVESTTAAVGRAREGRLNAADLQPAAITLSNLGMYGIDDFVALVEPGKTAILAAGQIAEVVVAKNGGIQISSQMKLTLSVDHRVVDGAMAALYLNEIREVLQSFK